jgi:accessory gene regulator protein AgrB
MNDALSKKRQLSKSLSRSSKRQAQAQEQKQEQKQEQEHSDIITLNYGFDITAVFELINEHIVYNKLITYYIKNRQNSIETIKAFLLIRSNK